MANVVQIQALFFALVGGSPGAEGVREDDPEPRVGAARCIGCRGGGEIMSASRTRDHLWTVMGSAWKPRRRPKMRVLGLVLAGALALTASVGVSRPGRWVQAGIQCPTVGTVTGVEHPAPRANGTADRFRRIGVRIVLSAGGPAVGGRGCPRTGSGVPAAAPLIIPLQIGEVRPGAGAIRSQPVLGPSGSGFTPPNEISCRGVKLPRVSAAFGRLELRRKEELPQVA
jgi:hypothetical protein